MRLDLTIAVAALLLAGAAWARGPQARFRDCPDCPEMAIIPAGAFTMGSPASEPGRTDAEGPQHRVVFARPFALGRRDVTRAEFAKFADATGFDPRDPKCDWKNPKVRGQPMPQTPHDPVVCVSHSDAKAYADWLSKTTGKAYRLPSEAEWEYAARAGTTTARFWGAEPSRAHANFGSDPCCGTKAEGLDRWLFTSPGGAFAPNRFGLFDMLGNVWQRTEDCGHADYQGAPADGSAWTSGDCSLRMIRGGGWFHGPEMLRSAARVADPAEFRKNDIGFRVARSL